MYTKTPMTRETNPSVLLASSNSRFDGVAGGDPDLLIYFKVLY